MPIPDNQPQLDSLKTIVSVESSRVSIPPRERILHLIDSMLNALSFTPPYVIPLDLIGKDCGWYIPADDQRQIDWKLEGSSISSKPLKTYSKVIDASHLGRIENLPELLIKLTEIVSEAYKKDVALNPVRPFGIKLIDEIVKGYRGRGELVLIPERMVQSEEIEEDDIVSYFTNYFLDEVVGNNLGKVIRKNTGLERCLLRLNSELIRDRKRDFRGLGMRGAYEYPDVAEKIHQFYKGYGDRKDPIL
jgi:hypothetical protein